MDSRQSILDYEVLEYILYSAYSRIDVKPIAKKLMNYFGSLNKVFNAEVEVLRSIDGVNDSAIYAIFCSLCKRRNKGFTCNK